MIAYRPVPPLPVGRPGVIPALAAMALTAVLGTSWLPEKSSAAPDKSPEPDGTVEPAGNAYPGVQT